MIKNIKIFVLGGAILLAAPSCQKMLEVSPKTALEAETALSTRLGLQAALNGTYAALRSATYYARDYVVSPELLADNVRLVQAATQSGRGAGLDVNAPGSHINIWSSAYSVIQKANLVIGGSVTVTDATAAQKASIRAQALSLRALSYLDLIRTYAYNPNFIQNGFTAGVPLVLDPIDDLSKVTLPARSSVTEVYAQIEKDLLEAVTLFGTAGVDAAAGKPFVFTRGAAQALLSRVYLYMGTTKYADVVTQSTAALASGVGTFQTTPASYVAMWNAATKPESMFEVQFATVSEVPQTSNNNTIGAYYVQQRNGTAVLGWGDIVISNNFLAEFEAGDARRSVTTTYTRSNGEVVTQTAKFPGSKGVFGWDNVPVIRISEMYLNRAEANARLGNTAAAQADLNIIRVRAGLTSIFPTGADLITAILKERRLEFAFEGYRWFDLTRLGLNIPKETIPTIPFSDYRILPAVPQSERDINKNLVQNPGY